MGIDPLPFLSCVPAGIIFPGDDGDSIWRSRGSNQVGKLFKYTHKYIIIALEQSPMNGAKKRICFCLYYYFYTRRCGAAGGQKCDLHQSCITGEQRDASNHKRGATREPDGPEPATIDTFSPRDSRTNAAQKSSDVGDRIKDQSEHTSRIPGTSTTAHDQRGHFALGLAGILSVDQRGALGDGGVVTDDRGTHMHPILNKVQKHGGSGLQRN
ncbi:hypothetical protein M405DRAFT_844070 [Rhizopogon salebrosus TDB-379]|nr:hypothetical protein M405DRAFT_844070 [Rhizopogon salebrosus TDB-379]